MIGSLTISTTKVKGFKYAYSALSPNISFFHIIGVNKVAADIIETIKGLKSLYLVEIIQANDDKSKTWKNRKIRPRIKSTRFMKLASYKVKYKIKIRGK